MYTVLSNSIKNSVPLSKAIPHGAHGFGFSSQIRDRQSGNTTLWTNVQEFWPSIKSGMPIRDGSIPDH